MEKRKMYIALKNSNIHINNKRVIYKLLENNDIDFLIDKIDDNIKIKVICSSLYGKKFLNGAEHFLMMLDAFISFYSSKLFTNSRDSYFLGRVFLKSNFSKILLLDKYFLKNFDEEEIVYSTFNKMMTDFFLNNLLLMKDYINPYFSNTNIDLYKLDYSDKSYQVVGNVLRSLFIANNDHITGIITYIFINMQKAGNNSLTSSIKIVNYWKRIFSNI